MKKSSILCLLLSANVFAGDMGEKFKLEKYLRFSSGGSFSMNSNIYADPAYWDASPQGYNGNLGNSALYAIAGGVHFSPLWSADIEYIYRPSFHYTKYQTSTAVNTPFYNGTKNRYFSFESNSLMANLYLKGSGLSNRLVYNGFEPFIGGGLGVAFNSVNDFYSQRLSDSLYRGILQDHLRTSLAFQFSAGIRLMESEHYELGAGYRYYNAGTFSTSTFVINTTDYSTPWSGVFQANEFFITLGYKF
jgi:opacity protein-like surface antigen